MTFSTYNYLLWYLYIYNIYNQFGFRKGLRCLSLLVCGIYLLYTCILTYLCIHKLNYVICVAKSRCVILYEWLFKWCNCAFFWKYICYIVRVFFAPDSWVTVHIARFFPSFVFKLYFLLFYFVCKVDMSLCLMYFCVF